MIGIREATNQARAAVNNNAPIAEVCEKVRRLAAVTALTGEPQLGESVSDADIAEWIAEQRAKINASLGSCERGEWGETPEEIACEVANAFEKEPDFAYDKAVQVWLDLGGVGKGHAAAVHLADVAGQSEDENKARALNRAALELASA